MGSNKSNLLHNRLTQRKLLRFNEIPLWMQPNPYIRDGYRRESSSVTQCLLSLFYVHNELFNTWSHLLPAVIHCLLLVYEYDCFTQQRNKWSFPGNIVVQSYIYSCITCLLCSVSRLNSS
jgi:adiponectin receptor